MRYRRLIAVFLVVLLLLSGCGAESMGSAVPDKGAMGNGSSAENSGLTGTTQTSQTEVLPPDQKLIRKVWIDAETENMDDLLTKVETRVSELAGYVEAREVYHGNKNSASGRYASLTIRIPAKDLQLFLDTVGEQSNVTSTREETEDVTLSYVETESKKKALEAEYARLMELLAKAETMDDILKIESKLTEIRGQLEKLGSQLKLYDNLVSYSTVYLTITEVKEYTVVEEEPETVWDRIGAGFSDSWDSMLEGLEDFFVIVVCLIPYLLPVGVLAAVALVIIFLIKRKKKDHPSKEEKEE